jgi:hypothetical protein
MIKMTSVNKKIIGFAGRKRAGKGALCEHLKETQGATIITIASALKELIRGSDRVFIMGHQFGDIDSLGASYGLWKCAHWLERESYIVLDEQKLILQYVLLSSSKQFLLLRCFRMLRHKYNL